jgi:hypothetical protein
METKHMVLPEIDLDSLPLEKQAPVRRLLQLKAADPRVRVKPKVAREMLGGIGENKYAGYIRDGKLEVVTENGQQWPLVGSLFDLMIAEAISPTPGAVRPTTFARKKDGRGNRSRRTPAQMDALAQINERKAEARAHKEAEAASS